MRSRLLRRRSATVAWIYVAVAFGILGTIVAALLPLVQSSENVFATAFLLHGRYDLRGAYQAGSTGLRLVAIALAAPLGVNQALAAIVVAQAVSTAAITVLGVAALRRFPPAA